MVLNDLNTTIERPGLELEKKKLKDKKRQERKEKLRGKYRKTFLHRG